MSVTRIINDSKKPIPVIFSRDAEDWLIFGIIV